MTTSTAPRSSPPPACSTPAIITGRDFKDVKVVVNGAGAAAIACTALIKAMGVRHENVILCDTIRPDHYRAARRGPVEERPCGRHHRAPAEEAMVGADIFLRPVGAGRGEARVGQEDGRQADHLRDGQPDPEIMPEEAKAVRPDAIIATGRSDFPIRSTTCWASPSSSAARWMCVRPASTRK
jgi:malate dehydrogenase (oxaloacetate-decarboxylating)(NADP+)